MIKKIKHLFILLLFFSCKNEIIHTENSDLEKNIDSSIIDSVRIDKNNFNESSNVFYCENNNFKTLGDTAYFSSIIFQNSKKYSFDFYGYNPEDGIIIIVDNLNNKFSMINLCTGKELIIYNVIDSIVGIYTFEPKRYFIETWKLKDGLRLNEVWEIEPDLERTMIVDLVATEMKRLDTASNRPNSR